MEIVCSAGCKRISETDVNGNLPPGWEHLQITGRYRCSTCYRELNAASSMRGTDAQYEPDPLPADSIGALKALPHREPLKERP